MSDHNTESFKAPNSGSLHNPGTDCFDSLLTVAEVAQLLRVPVSWVYERTRRRGTERLPHLKLGKYLRFSQPEVLGWLARMRGI